MQLKAPKLFRLGGILLGGDDATVVERADLIRMLQQIAGESVGFDELGGRESEPDLGL